jgi:hypothetical protein
VRVYEFYDVVIYSMDTGRCLCVSLGLYVGMYCSSLQEESSLSTCTEMLQTSNMEVFQHTAQLTAHFAKLNTYVKLLAVQSKR